jgi:2'-5' RNA ligase
MRLFIAVPIPPEIKTAVAELLAVLSRAGADVKWVRPENLHLTLSFLGERRIEDVSSIKTAVERSAREFAVFSLAFSRLGVFESWERPRVLWLGIERGANALGELAAGLDRRLARARIETAEKGRPFAAHLTLGRFRSRRHAERLRDAAASFAVPRSMEMPVASLILYESRLFPEGPSYTALAESELPTALGA